VQETFEFFLLWVEAFFPGDIGINQIHAWMIAVRHEFNQHRNKDRQNFHTTSQWDLHRLLFLMLLELNAGASGNKGTANAAGKQERRRSDPWRLVAT
jgi:hypothetical protein